MIKFTLNNKTLEFDETVEYGDFYIENGNPVAININFSELLKLMDSGDIEFSKHHFTMWSRWVNEAPRKRNLRKMRLDGMNVLTTEYLFETDEEFIDCLERTGKLAATICEIYGSDPMEPMKTTTSLSVFVPEEE